MNRSSWTNQALIVFILVLVLCLHFSVLSETFRVCKYGCEYSSVDRAVKDSESGDLIKIQNGDYTGNLRIDKAISLVGTNPRWVRITPAKKDLATITLGPSSTSVEIRNLTVTGGGTNQGNALSVKGDVRLALTNSLINNSAIGLKLADSSHAKLVETEVTDSRDGILVSGSSEVVVHDSSVSDTKSGLISGDSSEIIIIGTDISRCKKNSILAKNTGKINILSSTISDNGGAGVKLTDFSRLSMQDSQVSNNDGGGILLSNSAGANLTENKITYNGKKNLAIISKKCGFSGPTEGFFGKVRGEGNKIIPANPESVCPDKFSQIRSEEGGEYSYLFKPATYAFIGLIGVATVLFFITR